MRQQQNKVKYVLLAGPVPAKSTQGGRECARKGARFGRIFEPNACIRFERLSFFDSLNPSQNCSCEGLSHFRMKQSTWIWLRTEEVRESIRGLVPLLQDKPIFLKLQNAVIPHAAQFLGERTAIQIQVVGHLLPAEGNFKGGASRFP